MGTVGKIGSTGRAENIKKWKKIAELGMAQGFLECQTKSKVTTSSTYEATTGSKKMGFHALSK
jgi:sulfite exporter TauE/SafE